MTKELNKDYNIIVFCSSKSYEEQIDTYNNYKFKYVDLNANGVQNIPYDILSLFKSSKFADTILILDVSRCIALLFIKLSNKKQKL